MSTLGTRITGVALGLLMLLSACTTAQPTPTPTKAAEPTKPTAPAATAAAPKPAAPAATPVATQKPAASAASPTAAPKAQAPLPKDQVKVTLGVVTGSSDAAFFIANDKGYFREQGLQVEMTVFDTAARMVAPLAAGQLDIGGGSPSAGLFNAVSREIPIKIVADKGSVPANESYQGMMVRQDIWDSGRFKDYANLKGLKVAIAAEGIGGHVELDLALQKAGLTLKDVQIATMPFTSMGAAFAGKAIDAAIIIESYITDFEEKKIAKLFKRSNDFYPNHQQAVVMYSPNFVKEKPEAGRRFMVAYLKAARYYNDAFVKKNKAAFDEIVDILVKNTAVKDKSIYGKMTMAGISPNGEVLVKSLEFDQDWYVVKGYQKEKIDMNLMVDLSFAKYAVEQLGPYR
ncbi:MAG: ABC transporter substrate-binding protein [Chloroflexi bacterium]|nr:ABC transporter substrate-binding protein [Chloroflexota bacterium]